MVVGIATTNSPSDRPTPSRQVFIYKSELAIYRGRKILGIGRTQLWRRI